MEEANAVLAAFLPRYRTRFARTAADPTRAYRPLPKNLDLDGVCSFHYVRTVANDNTVRLEERLLQVPPGPGGRSYAGCRVPLQERLDGSLVAVYQGRTIALQPASTTTGAPLRARRRRGWELPSTPSPGKEPRRSPPPAHAATATNEQWKQRQVILGGGQ